ncbi:TfuA-like protein [Streptomyces justiciae]|uniref:TfuA-like protein n=1 Tax=Streptomyces justiciae TaxID=2780140 RepID=UPI0021190C16|nr:TfuA-like protein [Streptomyces justiciae]MCW8382386.1 TfuA-like protein [Streptomyces justiciae]
MTIHVFVGPTLPPNEALLAHQSVRHRPPVRHGDLFDAAIADTDTVVLIDGLYHQAPAVRHKEILAALARGVRVIGAASLGALRAAELWPYGMGGVGNVYRSYRNLEIVGDDEVAVGQDPMTGRALTWPMVNCRYVINLAVNSRILTGSQAAQLLEALHAVYYPQRTFAAIRAVCRDQSATAFADWLGERRSGDAYFGDIKRSDALTAIRAALHGPDPCGPVLSTLHIDSVYFRRWYNAFATEYVDGLMLPTGLRVAYQQLFDPDFRGLWEWHLDHLSRRPSDGSRGMPLAERMFRLTGQEAGPPAAHTVFKVPVDLRDAGTVDRLLAHETDPDRRAVARYLAANDDARRELPFYTPETVSDEHVICVLQQVWRGPDTRLEEEAVARGFRGLAEAVTAMKIFMAGYLRDRDQPVTDVTEATTDVRH